jgi:hypothetical protein
VTSKEFQAQYGRGQPTQAAPAKGKPKGPSPANALTQAVVQLLALHGYHAWRQNNAAVYDPTRQVFRAGSSTKGIADVLGYCCRTGRFAAVEVKVGKDKLSPEQTEFLAGVGAAGGFACEGRSLDQVQQELLAYLAT